jgi:2',3'-cyclic-nucleotide 2'-phosphodiesterase (5'-nucleotidase family)
MRRNFGVVMRIVYAVLLLGLLAAPAWAAQTLTLIYSGNLDGELEPCGCSEEGNLGGIKRRATLLDRLRQENPGLVVVSAGGLLSAEGAGDRLKGEYILKGFAALDYDAIGLQWGDLAYGVAFARQTHLPWVASNWRDRQLAHEKRIHRGQVELAFFTWLPPEDSPLRAMQGKHALVTDAAKALAQGLARAKQAGALTLLTSSLPAEAVAKRVDLGQVDILMERAGYEVYAEPRRLGGTLVLKPGSRGMRLGRLDLQVAKGRLVKWAQQVLPMPDSMPDAPRLLAWYDEYNAKVKADYLKRVALRKQQTAGESPFVGEEACKSCHEAQYAVWSKSDHAQAYYDLENVNKAFDPACIVCHTVGFDKPGGFIDMNITGHLLNVQCESCHGAGRAHVKAAGKAPLANAGWAPQRMCAQCHTQPHSPSFDFQRYWPKIAH